MTDNRKKRADAAEEAFAELRRSQGYLSFVRARRTRFGQYDMWSEFDVFSMNADVLELAQVKIGRSRSAQKDIREWMRENDSILPKNLRCVVAVLNEKTQEFRIIEVERDV